MKRGGKLGCSDDGSLKYELVKQKQRPLWFELMTISKPQSLQPLKLEIQSVETRQTSV